MSYTLSRRNFIKASALTAATTGGLHAFGGIQYALPPESMYVIGPLKGYSPNIGTLVSMLHYNRQTVINSIKDLSVNELDFLVDEHANTIGALVMHLGATEKFYQINTFEGRQDFNEDESKAWGAAIKLGDEGRAAIKGKNAAYYIGKITEVREKTLDEFKKRDDKWLAAIDPEWSKEQPLNTYWKWFHVCEHESNHRGQIAWLKSRLPGAKPVKD